jgi:hypothetical protein
MQWTKYCLHITNGHETYEGNKDCAIFVHSETFWVEKWIFKNLHKVLNFSKKKHKEGAFMSKKTLEPIAFASLCLGPSKCI